ncbi:MAG: hypothetical protein HOP96_05780 [Sphingomonas sp.]|nr:hypothetical protein [Sphingomonas sp.]
MKSIRKVALAAGAAFVAVTPAFANHSWGPYHWASNGKGVDLTVNLAITSQWNASVNGGIADWEQSKKLSFSSRTATLADNGRKLCRPIAGELIVCNAAYGQRGWLGIATIWISGVHITQATTQLNDTYFEWARYNTPAWRSLVACQEIAHDFGLDHQDENFSNYNLGSCMDYTSAPAGGVYNGFDYGPSNEHPNDHDYEQITTIYSHDDGTAAAATNFGVREVGKPAPLAMDNSPPGLSPSEWGRAVGYDARGRPDTFEKTLAPGQKRLTHVFWLPDSKASR